MRRLDQTELNGQISGYPFVEEGPTRARHNDSKLTIPTIKQSLTPSPFEKEQKRVSADFSKSQVVLGGDKHKQTKKPTKSAIFGSEMDKMRKGKSGGNGEEKRKRHQNKISNLTNELRSLHTYKNSNLSLKKQMRFERFFNANLAEKAETGSGDSNSGIWTHYNLKKKEFLKSLCDLKKIQKANPKSGKRGQIPTQHKKQRKTQSNQPELTFGYNLKSENLLSPKLERTVPSKQIRKKKQAEKNRRTTPAKVANSKVNRRTSNARKLDQKEFLEEKKVNEQVKIKIKKPCFTQLLYTNRELNEAYEELLKKNEKEKDEGKKTRKKPKSKPITPKSAKRGTLRGSQKFAQMEAERKLKPSRSRTPKQEKHLDLTNMVRKFKKVNPKVNTGLEFRKNREIRREKLDEWRRVKKDFVLSRVVLPEMHLRMEANFQKLELCKTMGEVLVVFEPKNVNFDLVKNKIEEDNVDYISVLEPNENMSSEILQKLHQAQFDFGEEDQTKEALDPSKILIENLNIFKNDKLGTSKEKQPIENKIRQIFTEIEAHEPEKPPPNSPHLKRPSNIFTIDLDDSDRNSLAHLESEFSKNRSRHVSKGISGGRELMGDLQRKSARTAKLEWKLRSMKRNSSNLVLTNSKRGKKKKLKGKKGEAKGIGKLVSRKRPIKIKKVVVGVKPSFREKLAGSKKMKKKKFPRFIKKSKKIGLLLPTGKLPKKGLSRRSQVTHESSNSVHSKNKRFSKVSRGSLTSLGSERSFGFLKIAKTGDSDYFNLKGNKYQSSKQEAHVMPNSEYFPCERLSANLVKFASIDKSKNQRMSYNSQKQKKLVLNRTDLKRLRNAAKKPKLKKRSIKKTLSKPRLFQPGEMEKIEPKVVKIPKKGAKKGFGNKGRRVEIQNEKSSRKSGKVKRSWLGQREKGAKKSCSPFGKKHEEESESGVRILAKKSCSKKKKFPKKFV